MPRISVILPVYNSEKYIKEAVDSILNQSFEDFELLIINDASTDRTLELLQEYQDSRLHIINNQTNLKVVKSLNKGLSLAKGEYIARMDADDISHPQRFEKQIKFFETHPDIDFVSTWVQTIGSEFKVMRAATTHEHIKVRLLFLNPIFHPTVMFKKIAFEKHSFTFDEKYTNAEDYGLWVLAIDKLKFATIPEVLLKYRIHDQNVSVIKTANRKVLDEIHDNIYRYFFEKLKLTYNESDLLLHRKLGLVEVEALTQEQFLHYMEWLKTLLLSNNKSGYFDKLYFKNVIISYLLYISGKTISRKHAFITMYQTFKSLISLSDITKFLAERATVKLRSVKTF